MLRAGIDDGDILVVDRSIEPRSGMIVVASVDGGFTVKRLFRTRDRTELRPDSDDPSYRTIVLQEGQQLDVFGVVSRAVKQFIK